MLAAGEAPADDLRVVTSDRRLGERVRELGVSVTPAGAFRRRVDRVLASMPTDGP
jgi:rRNA-processing protein FCF1